MHKIEIDGDVFKCLQGLAVPFVDTPNDVLRRILEECRYLTTSSERKTEVPHLESITNSNFIPSELFVEMLLKRFGEYFRKVGQRRYMFESENYLIYFQNFNKPGDRLWFRITDRARAYLRQNKKKVFLILTNPSERLAFKIPFQSVEQQAHLAEWDRPHLEANIVGNRWVELHWDLKDYKEKIDS